MRKAFGLVLFIFMLMLLYRLGANSEMVDKKIVLKEVCDSANMENWFTDCLNESIIAGMNRKATQHYTSDCRKQARANFCKQKKHIAYIKKGKIIKLIPCVSATKKSDIKLCNNNK